jgi:hypothetical protein
LGLSLLKKSNFKNKTRLQTSKVKPNEKDKPTRESTEVSI